MRYLVLIILLNLVSFEVLAHKDVGGGNIVGGVLLDKGSYKNATQLDGLNLLTLFLENESLAVDRFPLIANYADELFTSSKTWYLDDSEYVPECLNQTMDKSPKVVVACQNDVEVRIKRNWWNSASPKDRADILMHELITALWLKDEHVKTINGVVAGLIDPNVSQEQVEQRMLSAGIPHFWTKNEIKILSGFYSNYAADYCKVSNLDDAFSVYRKHYSSSERRDSLDAATLDLDAKVSAFEIVKSCSFGPKNCSDSFTTDTEMYYFWKTWKATQPRFFPESIVDPTTKIYCPIAN